MKCQKKIFHLLFFPKWRINACYRNAHITKGFCVVHSAKLWAAAARDTRQAGVRWTPCPPSWNWYPGRREGQQVLHAGRRGSLAWGHQCGTESLPEGRETCWRQQAGGVHRHKERSPPNKESVQRSWDRKGQSLLEERSRASQGFVNRSGEKESFNLRSVSTTEEFNQENASIKPPESHHPDWQLLTFCCGTFGKIFWGPYAHKHRPLTCSNVEWDNTVSLLICFSLSTICDGHHFRSVNMDLWHYVSGSLVNHFSKRPQCSWVSADSQLSCFHFPPFVDKPQWPPWHCRVFLPTQQCWILLSSRLWLSQRPGLPLIWRFAVCMLVRLKKT